MGKKTVLVDDYDGKELPDDTKPVTLSLGRTTYSLYLSENNYGKLMEAVNPFIENAETGSSNATGGSSGSAARSDKADQRNARVWAIETGFKFKNAAGEEKTLGDRGRIPDAVMNGWKEAGSPVAGEQ